MNVALLAKKVQKFTADNSPLLLTALGVVGTVTTAYLTGKASFKAAEIINERLTYPSEITLKQRINRDVYGERLTYPSEITLKQRINLVWKQYIPPVLTGVATVTAIIGANQVGTRRTAALAAAYSISERAFSEYKDKVVEKLGEHREQSVRDDLAQDRVNANPVSTREVFITGRGEVTCYEHFTGRYFQTTYEDLKKAQNDLNYRLNNDGYASLSDFYDLIGLPHTTMSEEVGWTSEKLMELDISTVLTDTMEPCLSIDYRVKPVRNYFRFR